MPRRLSYANVTATLALFVALGGSGYAAAKIRGNDIAPRTITAKNVKRGTLTGKELSRGAVTAAKLSPGLRAQLPSDDGFGPGDEPLPGLDGPPGPPGDPGEPGPPGTGGCAAELGLLCGDADLPAGTSAQVLVGGTAVLALVAYRTTCAPQQTPDCEVLLAGAGFDADVDDVLGANAFTIVLSGAGARRLAVTGADPLALRDQGERWQIAVSADAVAVSGP